MTLAVLAQYCSFITAIMGAVVLFIRPVRNKLFGLADIIEGQKCSLRSHMLAIYYRGKEDGNRIRQYDFENFCLLYAAYKAENGNTFIDKVKEEVFDMEVVK